LRASLDLQTDARRIAHSKFPGVTEMSPENR
jgi:hypothetical protein